MSITPAGEQVGALPKRRPAHPLALFFKGFVKHPGMVGSIIPSSTSMVNKMLAPVDWSRVKLFVEYGPGVGTFTLPILERLPADAELIAIDLNREFVDFLRREVRDSRLRVVCGSAVDVRRIVADLGHSHADYVLSGLPFSTLPEGLGDRIAEETAEVLAPDGVFLVYQLSGKVGAFLSRCFGRIDRGFEWFNIPPMKLFWARK